MSTEISCEKILIKDIFTKWYRIPEYQRPYVWDRDQVLELLEDIMGAYHNNPEAQYFLGSMVLKINDKNENGVSYKEYELLDGQQRVTTMFLLFAVIRDLVDRDSLKQIADGCIMAIYQEEDVYNEKPERIRIVFDIRDDVKTFVNEYIKIDKGTSKVEELKSISEDDRINVSVRNMAKAILTMKEFFNENSTQIAGFYKFFRTKVLMIYVATEELQDAFQLFTVLNNRGVKLSNSDILKAINLKEVPNTDDRTQWAKKWEEMESYFGADFDNFLSHIRTILVKSKANANLLKEYEDNIYSPTIFDRTRKQYVQRTPLLIKGKTTFEYINKFYKLYMDIFDKDHYQVHNNYDIYNYLTLMRNGLGADYWIAPLLYYYSQFKEDKFVEFIKALDRKVSADWITSLSPTIRIENVNAILKDIEKSTEPDEVLSSQSLEIDAADFERVINRGVYGRRYAKYLLLKVDLLFLGKDSKFNPPATISIEHILPQHPSQDSQWVKDFTVDERKELTDKIGNLALISRRKNTSQGNKDYKDKKEKYFKNNIEVFPNSIRIYRDYEDWTPSSLNNNHKEVIEKLIKVYRL